MKRSWKIAALSLAAAFATACDPYHHKLGEDNDSALKSETKNEVMFDGRDAERHLTIDAAGLKSGHTYEYDASLTILGNIPDKTNIMVKSGRLEIMGDVGRHCQLSAKVPLAGHDVKTTVLMPVMRPMGKSYYVSMVPMPKTETVIDGLAYPGDRHAGIRITGDVKDSTSIDTNAGIEAKSFGKGVSYKTGWGRDLQLKR